MYKAHRIAWLKRKTQHLLKSLCKGSCWITRFGAQRNLEQAYSQSQYQVNRVLPSRTNTLFRCDRAPKCVLHQALFAEPSYDWTSRLFLGQVLRNHYHRCLLYLKAIRASQHPNDPTCTDSPQDRLLRCDIHRIQCMKSGQCARQNLLTLLN
jgi:hypothetical protein